MKLKLFLLFSAFFILLTGVAKAAIQGPQGMISKPKVEMPKIEMKYGKGNIVQSKQPSVEKKTLPEQAESSSQNAVKIDNASLEIPVSYSCSKKGEIEYCIDEQSKPLKGKYAQKISEGNYASIENFNRGYRNGLCTYFDNAGRRKLRIYYKNGLPNGMCKYYYQNRGIKISANYKDGLLDGYLEVYLIDGRLYGRMRYKKGKLEKGFCMKNDKKETFDSKMLKSFPENQINSCGLPL